MYNRVNWYVVLTDEHLFVTDNTSYKKPTVLSESVLRIHEIPTDKRQSNFLKVAG